MEKYKVVGIVPGRVHTYSHGLVDLSEELPEKVLDELYETGFPYLEKVAEAPVSPTPQASAKKTDKPKPQES